MVIFPSGKHKEEDVKRFIEGCNSPTHNYILVKFPFPRASLWGRRALDVSPNRTTLNSGVGLVHPRMLLFI